MSCLQLRALKRKLGHNSPFFFLLFFCFLSFIFVVETLSWIGCDLGSLGSLLGIGLDVLVGEVSDETANGDNAVEAKAAAGGGTANGGGVLGDGLGDRVAGLETKR